MEQVDFLVEQVEGQYPWRATLANDCSSWYYGFTKWEAIAEACKDYEIESED
jgi:hypothetical protein